MKQRGGLMGRLFVGVMDAGLGRWFEVEGGEVHLAFGDDVDGEDVAAGGEVEGGGVGEEVPVVPLAPGDGLVFAEGAGDGDGRAGDSVDVEGDAAAAVGGVEEVGGVAAGVGYVDGEVEPLAGDGPADVELAVGWGDEVVGVVVDGDFGVVELGVGRVDAFVHAELVEVGSVGGVELAGAVV